MKHAALPLIIAAVMASACASGGGHTPADDPQALAALQASVRMVNGESTWVTRGAGYELVGRTKSDLLAVQWQLEREAMVFRRAFGGDSIPPVVVTVGHMPVQGKPFIAPAPVPTTTLVPVVEVVLPDPKAHDDDQGGRPRGGAGMFGLGTPTQSIARAWLSGRASALTHTKAPSAQANGQVEDPRVPAWALDALPALSADSAAERQTAMLASHPETLYPLSSFLTMSRPPFVAPTVAQRGGGEGGGRGGGEGGGMRGGRGGGRGGMGGSRGGGGGRPQGGGGEMLQGGALFEAQAAVFSRYLIAREGYDFVGALIDTQIQGKPVDDLLTQRKTISMTQMEADWPRWLAGAAGKGRG